MKIAGFGFAYLALATVLGAFGAHLLRDSLSPASMAVFHTGHQYQTMAAFALIAVGLAQGVWPTTRFRTLAWILTGGSLIFSGSLYALALSGIKMLGAITPIGGVLMIGSLLACSWQLIRPQLKTD